MKVKLYLTYYKAGDQVQRHNKTFNLSYNLSDYKIHLTTDLVVQVMFICNHCPFVKHLKKDIVKLSNFYMKVR